MSGVQPLDFSFVTPATLMFRRGGLADVPGLCSGFGRRALLVSGATGRFAEVLIQGLADHGIDAVEFRVSGEPDISLIDRGVEAAAGCDFVIALGGGSVMDAGKAISALATNPGGPLEYLEVVGKGRHLENDPLPMAAIPTTSGTGSEVTKNAVLTVPDKLVKVSLRDVRMVPDLVMVDPRLTLGLPPEVTAATGMDALTQVIEPYVSPMANPVTDGLCREGIIRAGTSLENSCSDGGNIDARENMAIASLFGGLALANAKLGVVHALAGPLGGMYGRPHGMLCASLLPEVMNSNCRVLEQQAESRGAAADSTRFFLTRYDEIGRLLTGHPDAGRDEGIAFVRELCRNIGIPGLAELGVREEDYPLIIEKAMRASGMKGNPVELTGENLREILRASM